MVFLKEFFLKVDFERSKSRLLPSSIRRCVYLPAFLLSDFCVCASVRAVFSFSDVGSNHRLWVSCEFYSKNKGGGGVISTQLMKVLLYCNPNRNSHSSTPINWTSPFPFKGLMGGIFYFYSDFKGTFCKQTAETLIRRHLLLHLNWVCIVCLYPTK